MARRASARLLAGALAFGILGAGCSSTSSGGGSGSPVPSSPINPAATDGPGTTGTQVVVSMDPDLSPLYAAACAGKLVNSTTGKVQAPELDEISGVVVSRKDPGVLWVHNDSGGKPEVYAIDPAGELLGTYRLAGAQATDWEDIGLGPGAADADSLYLGDIGDNNARRSNVTVYRVVEPSVNGAEDNGTGTQLGPVDTFTLTYPDGPHNAEAMLVDPTTGDLVIITKETNPPSVVFTAPKAKLTNGAAVTLDKVGVLSLGSGAGNGLASLVTGADISADGGTIAVRTYGDVYLYHRGPGQSVGQALAGTPCAAKVAVQGQGESVGIAPDGRHMYMVPEGANAPIDVTAVG